jgi:rSAM/selenodomain-associated transferase 1
VSGATVIVMAKAPRAGLAKTRLIPALGAEGAAALARRMLQHTLLQALAARLGPVVLCGTPRGDDPDFGLPADHGLQLSDQGEGDLGARMQRAFVAASADASTPAPLLMIGTDAPAVDAAMLQDAAAALATRDAVFVPALDGGYALIGLIAAAGAPLPPVFDAMPWSTPQLMAATRARLAASGLRHAELPAVADIDEPADLVHLPAGWLA